MPGFDNKSIKRISDVVRHVEAEGRDNTPDKLRFRGDSPLVWFLLTEDFDPDDNNQAKARPGWWSASANSGDGELTAEPAGWYYVRDTTGQCGASEGDWVLCRSIGSDNGSVWEVLTPGVGFDRCTCTLAGAMTANKWDFPVDVVKSISGSSPLMDPDSITETLQVYNIMGWEGDDDGVALIEWDKSNKRWHFYNVECPA